MNKVILMGRLVREPEVINNSILKNSLAVTRNYKDKNSGKYESDFIPIIAFEKTANHIAKYFKKGSMIAVEGNMRSGSYKNQKGETVYTLECSVSQVYFCGDFNGTEVKSDGAVTQQKQVDQVDNYFADFETNAPFLDNEIKDEDLPF